MDKKPIKFLHWNINRTCNYNCSYCISGNRKKSSNPDSNFLLDKFKKHLMGSWRIQLSGSGEPFLTLDFFKVVDKLIRMGHKIGVITNFSSSLEDLVKFCQITENKIFSFEASLHLEEANIDEFIKKAIVINKLIKGILLVKSVAVKGKVKRVCDIGKKFKKEGIHFSLQPQRICSHKLNGGNDPFIDYNKNEKLILKKFKRFHYGKKKFMFKGKKCWAGVKYLSVYENGEVWRCLPAKYYKLNKDYLGNILDDNFKLRKYPDKCNYKYCYCPAAYLNNIIIDK